MVRNHRFTLPNCALKLGSITCKANHIYHFNVLFAEKNVYTPPTKVLFFEHPIPLRITFFVHAISYHFIWCYSHDPSWVSKKATCQSFQGYSQQFVRFPPDPCYSFRFLRRERNYAKYILIVKYFTHKQSKMTHYWLRS